VRLYRYPTSIKWYNVFESKIESLPYEGIVEILLDGMKSQKLKLFLVVCLVVYDINVVQCDGAISFLALRIIIFQRLCLNLEIRIFLLAITYQESPFMVKMDRTWAGYHIDIYIGHMWARSGDDAVAISLSSGYNYTIFPLSLLFILLQDTRLCQDFVHKNLWETFAYYIFIGKNRFIETFFVDFIQNRLSVYFLLAFKK
jgi:hypothetical protein